MPKVVRCPNAACRASCSVADAAAGRPVKCPKCDKPFVARPTIDGQMVDTKKGQPSTGKNLFPLLPAEFGRYRVLKLLGQGGMGAVYLAQDTHLKRQVALKLPYFDASDSPQRAERFVREAQSAASLHHPNICTVFDAGQIDGRPFITMAYISGSPLSDEIDPDKPMPQRRSAEIVRKVALALEHAHAEGTVHRDLKPANVMMSAAGEPVVMDFGLAKRFGEMEPGEAKLTRLGAIIGTPSYLSPEQAQGEAIGPATDVYSLGVILFEMLTGKTPYSGSQLATLMYLIVAAPVPTVEEFRAGVDSRLNAICRRAMAKDVGDRFSSMAEFAGALGEYLNAPVAAPPPPPKPVLAHVDRVFALAEKGDPFRQLEAAPGRVARSRRKKKVRLLLVALALLVPLTVGLATVVLRVETPNGTLVVEMDGDEVEAKIKGGRLVLSGPDGKTRYTLSAKERSKKLDAGPYKVRVEGADGLALDTSEFTLKKGDRVTVRVRAESKPGPAKGANAASPDRSAGEYVLSIGGTVNDNRNLKTASDLPNDFRLTKFDLGGKLPNSDVLSRFEGCKNVRYLYLVGAGVTDECLMYFKDCKNLTRFELGGTRVTAKGLSHFGDCTELDFLGLNDSGVNDEGLSQFRNCKNIKTLELASQRGTDAGLSNFKDCKDIVSLNLKNSRVTDASVGLFKECKKLEALSLAFTGVSGTCLVHFPNLRTLWLEGSRIGNEGLKHVGQCKKLEYLELEGAPVDDDGLAYLAELTALRRLRLAGTKVTEKGVAALSRKLPECRIEWSGGVFDPVAKAAANAGRPADGFVPLFNGKDMAGWKTHQDPRNPNRLWSVEDGAITNDGATPTGLTYERQQFQNFHLRVETMPVVDRFGGVILRHNAGNAGSGNLTYRSEIEGPEYTAGTLLLVHDGFTRPAVVLRRAEKAEGLKVGEWYVHEMIVTGNRVQAFVNGKRVSDYTDDKTPVRFGAVGCYAIRGAKVRIRKIEIKELPPEKK